MQKNGKMPTRQAWMVAQSRIAAEILEKHDLHGSLTSIDHGGFVFSLDQKHQDHDELLRALMLRWDNVYGVGVIGQKGEPRSLSVTFAEPEESWEGG